MEGLPMEEFLPVGPEVLSVLIGACHQVTKESAPILDLHRPILSSGLQDLHLSNASVHVLAQVMVRPIPATHHSHHSA